MMKKIIITYFILLTVIILSAQEDEQIKFAVAPVKMNVLYTGIDNPVSIAVSHAKKEDIEIKISHGTIKKSEIKNNDYIVKIMKDEDVVITIFEKGKLIGTREFRVLTVPKPIATLGIPSSRYYKGGMIPKSTLLALSGINATMENFDFDLRAKVIEFTLFAYVNEFQIGIKSKSRKFTTEQKSLIRSQKRGEKIIIENVKIKMPDGTIQIVNDLVYKIR